MYRPESVVDSRKLGFNQARWLRGGGTAVFVPENFEPAYRYPVVVWLEASGAGFEARTWFPLISSRNFLVISLRPPRTGGAAWGASREDRSLALEYVSESVAEVSEEILVHPRRIFLAGCGDGGHMAADILCSEPELFAGAILIDPAVVDQQIWFDDRPEDRVRPLLIATGQDGVVQTLRDRYGTGPQIAEVTAPSKPLMARSINHWLMERIDSITMCGLR